MWSSLLSLVIQNFQNFDLMILCETYRCGWSQKNGFDGMNQWKVTGVVGRSGTIEAGAGSSLDHHGGLVNCEL